ncbi:MAG: hypothetical protein HYZ26_03535 [Chloroflexi bacterium]|nr:hypothetical protein [Chloroflexota bacterium]
METAVQTQNPSDFQAAVDYAVNVSNIDFSNVNGPIEYNPEQIGDAITNSDAQVAIGQRAFVGADGTPHSPGWLLLALVHEVEAHINRQLYGGRWYNTDTTTNGGNLNEIEAYDLQLALAYAYGLTDAEIALLLETRGNLNALLDPESEERVRNGNYTLPEDASGNPYDPDTPDIPVIIITPPPKTYSPL